METPSVIPSQFETPQDNFPFPAPFILSSLERDWCRFQQNKTAAIVFIKRRHLEENLKTIEQSIGMDETERKRFLDYWCSARGEEIRAEGDPYFDLRQRAESWMERRKPNTTQTKSRLEQYAESARQAFGASQPVPPGDTQSAGIGYTVLPDEQ